MSLNGTILVSFKFLYQLTIFFAQARVHAFFEAVKNVPGTALASIVPLMVKLKLSKYPLKKQPKISAKAGVLVKKPFSAPILPIMARPSVLVVERFGTCAARLFHLVFCHSF